MRERILKTADISRNLARGPCGLQMTPRYTVSTGYTVLQCSGFALNVLQRSLSLCNLRSPCFRGLFTRKNHHKRHREHGEAQRTIKFVTFEANPSAPVLQCSGFGVIVEFNAFRLIRVFGGFRGSVFSGKRTSTKSTKHTNQHKIIVPRLSRQSSMLFGA
jgi:hypothetical protein